MPRTGWRGNACARWRTGCRSPLLTACLLATLLSGCAVGPTFPKAALADSLKTILAEDGLTATTRFIDHTLAMHVEHPGALAQTEAQIGLGPEFDTISRKTLQAVHRVILSTDADVRFYVVLFSDPATPGAYLTLVRNIDDVRKANANMLDMNESFARTILELNYVGGDTLHLESYVERDIQLEEFLSWQLARRLQTRLAEELGSAVAGVGRCGGEFQNGEFVFTLNIVPSDQGSLDEATLRKVFQVSTSVVAKVLGSYSFQDSSRCGSCCRPPARTSSCRRAA